MSTGFIRNPFDQHTVSHLNQTRSGGFSKNDLAFNLTLLLRNGWGLRTVEVTSVKDGRAMIIGCQDYSDWILARKALRDEGWTAEQVL